MILNLGSIEYNASVSSGGNTPSWGTEMGQGDGYHFSFENMPEFFTAMVYKAVDVSRVWCPLGKGGNNQEAYQYVIASLFDKVYVNDMLVPEARFLLLVVKLLEGDHHVGRRSLKYNPNMKFDDELVNEDCFRRMRQVLGVSAGGTWFVSEINLKHQDELHFTAHVLDTNTSLAFSSAKARKDAFLSLINESTSKRMQLRLGQLKECTFFLPYLTALRAKPFLLLAGISGTGKSRIVRKLAQATVTEKLQRAAGYRGADFETDRWTLHRPANFELVQVKPNWHNSMDVVGYLSNIPTPHYVFTPFVEFIVRAWQHTDVPFFLCLDEMNLAPVEEYFAEYLSAVESRSFEGEGADRRYVTDPIIKPFKEFKKVKNDKGEDIDVGKMMLDELVPAINGGDAPEHKTMLAQLSEQLRERGLTLPPNLMVIGTVNMDETTFSFSRKVLDRAMSIEMNEVDYGCFLLDTTDDGLKALVGAMGQDTLNRLLVERHIAAREVAAALGDEAQRVVDYLTRVNTLLDGTPFKLGYRAANEALLYVEAARSFGQNDYASAMDSFTLMKILSRIEGDQGKLRLTESDADKARLAAARVDWTGEGMTLLDGLRLIVADELGDTCRTLHKLDAMRSQLERDQFVSYWN